MNTPEDYTEPIELIEHRTAIAVAQFLREPNGFQKLFATIAEAEGRDPAYLNDGMERFIGSMAASIVNIGPDAVDAVTAAAEAINANGGGY